ncbi:MAG: hydroxyisourate hydrolase [Acidobacteriota bacterium]
MSAITTHVLDTSTGSPASGLSVTLHRREDDGEWAELAKGTTDEDGRIGDLLPEARAVRPGTYRLTFATRAYFESKALPAFYPLVQVTFTITDADQHYHVPLLLSPFGYSTYRGS